ncbi:MBL fold metallo-hydrolase [Pseudofrankia asymbiotica]|uniref:MBL fold metallo-hydrolase n=1 Tax=Pseudofrankia asymbiotica TaxID=1834516 RepID=A0A1V2I9B1_9ACTN|nr:MBL fold metallo-hydrolase [Pseudofrankia asymbiotica]ONH29143.1 MBL fold metallo-hydrolase [Pseudofrankia asymbiotica]
MTSLTQPPSVDLPPVERLRPGLWSIPVPLPSIGLRHVFVYLFETDAGGYIVDAGWDTEEAYGALSAGLAIAGYRIGDVRGVLATHMHNDHYGLAKRIRDESGAWVALHPADVGMLKRFSGDPTELRAGMARLLVRAGVPTEEIATMTRALPPAGAFPAPALPDVLIEDGERPDVPGWDLRAIWTPGHSPGHLCFWEPANQLLLSGDHVLPRITPNIPFSPVEGDDPLGDYLASLDKVGAYPAQEALPAHEYRIANLPARLAELRAHHDQRFAEIIAAIRDGVTTAWAICQRMTWSRPWHDVEGFMKRAALAEGFAHLRALEHRGVVRELDGDPPTWELTAG